MNETCHLNGGTVEGNTCVCPIPFYWSSANVACDALIDGPNGTAGVSGQNVTFDPYIDVNLPVEPSSTFQDVLFILTFVLLGVWTISTLSLRFAPLRGMWFKLRRFVLLVDYAFAKKHWNDVQKVAVKRKTELGGVLSIGAFTFIIGLCLREAVGWIQSKEFPVQTVVLSNSTEKTTTKFRSVQDFGNNLNISITAVGNLSCSQFQPHPYVSVGFRHTELFSFKTESFIHITCDDNNGSGFPVVSVTCPACNLEFDDYYIAFNFVDRPDLGLYALAAGFYYNLSVFDPSVDAGAYLNGFVIPGAEINFQGVLNPSGTFRGPLDQPSVLLFRLTPRVLPKQMGSNLLSPTFQDFMDGSQFLWLPDENSALLASIGEPNQGVAVVVHVQVASQYIVQTTFIPTVGIISFLGVVGGLYQLGVLMFFITLYLCERFVTYLRYDDKLLNRLEKQRLARFHWKKLRLAVKYGFLVQSMKKPRAEGIEGGEAGEGEGDAFLGSEGAESGGDHVAVKVAPAAGEGEAAGTAAASGQPQGAAAGSAEGDLESGGGGEGVAATEKKEQWGWLSGLFRKRDMYGTRGALNPESVEVSASMEHREREAIHEQYPDIQLPPENIDPIHVAEKGDGIIKVAAAAQVKSAQAVVRSMSGIKSGTRAVEKTGKSLTGVLAKGISRKLTAEGDKDPSTVHVQPAGLGATALPHSASDGKGLPLKKKKKGSHQDSRLGSTSEHQGIMIKKIRTPSWFRTYELLPVPPSLEAYDAERKRAKRAARRGAEAVPLLEPVSEEPGSPDSDEEEDMEVRDHELYNHLMDLYDYQTRFRMDFLAAETMLENVIQRFRPHSDL